MPQGVGQTPTKKSGFVLRISNGEAYIFLPQKLFMM
jgi:hypothetical protein